MLRHVIAPLRHFSQISNEILRHPRLSSDAVRILTWQLSLPPGAEESLSRTAVRAGIGKGAFNRAKAQLKGEGFVHEWRQQGLRGLWSTVQLVSSVPLTAEEALAVRNGRPTAADERTGRTKRTGRPADACPAAGEPKGRGAGRHPEKPTAGNTSTPPPPPAPAPPADPECDREARELVDSITALDPRLAVPRGMVPQLVALASEWLSLGHTADDVRGQVRRGLPGRERAIHRPGGLLRYLLREPGPVLPPSVTPPVSPPAAAPPPRLAAMRECDGPHHMQPMLFTPEGDEELCAMCRDASPLRESAAAAATARGAAAVRAGLAGRRSAARH
ncbi:hypothetical protein [Streptomyces sp. NPDC014685]|uniref:hypothetical protein n=1 Tax=Streptomyces sp. NPDC014685 TaxID=3364881 RepID=UPI0036F92BC7